MKKVSAYNAQIRFRVTLMSRELQDETSFGLHVGTAKGWVLPAPHAPSPLRFRWKACALDHVPQKCFDTEGL